jgi:hypothetical protein
MTNITQMGMPDRHMCDQRIESEAKRSNAGMDDETDE